MVANMPFPELKLFSPEWQAAMHAQREAEVAHLPLPEPPELPEGHTLTCTPEEARHFGHWKAKGDHRNIYEVGRHRWTWINGVEEERSVDAWGVESVRYSRRDQRWTEDPPMPGDEAFDALPEVFRVEPWTAPAGSAADPKRVTAMQAAKGWMKAIAKQGKRSSMWIAGQPGRGKTQIAHWIAVGLADANVPVVFKTTREMQAALRASYDGGDHAKYQHELMVQACEKAHVLILDDVGAEANAEDVRAMLFRIVDHRWSNNLPTLATSNATPAQLATGGMDGRLVSRFGSYFAVLLTGADYRQQRGA